jgi:signal transduction histidine kinase
MVVRLVWDWIWIVSNSAHNLNIKVQDSGVGISEEEIDAILQW